MKLIILSNEFYSKYGHCKEILKKKDRPYYCVSIKIDGHLFAIPLRHHIRHAYGFLTVGDAGLDYTKAVLVDDPSFIASDKPKIDSREWNILRSNEDLIFKGFSRYLRQYKRGLLKADNPRSIKLMKFSTLQYFDINP
ncbi:MAG: hypothetical protein IJ860_07775 [Eubacterium sp.]|nr:hypothetical protein [Eubacterium sp.]